MCCEPLRTVAHADTHRSHTADMLFFHLFCQRSDGKSDNKQPVTACCFLFTVHEASDNLTQDNPICHYRCEITCANAHRVSLTTAPKQTNKQKKKVQKWCTKTIVSFFFFFKKTPHLSWKWAYFTPLELNIWAFIIIYCIQTISGSLLTWHRTFNRIRLLASRSKNDKSFDIIPIQSWILLYLDRAHWKKYIHWIY